MHLVYKVAVWSWLPIPLQPDTKPLLNSWPCEWEHRRRGAPGSALTPTGLQLTLRPPATHAGASENQVDFSYHLPPLTPADMQDASSNVPLKEKVASPLHNNSEE